MDIRIRSTGATGTDRWGQYDQPRRTRSMYRLLVLRKGLAKRLQHDLFKRIENYVTVAESNVGRARAYQFETVYQRIYKYMVYNKKLLKILNELEEADTFIELLEKVKYVADLLPAKGMYNTYMHAGYLDKFIMLKPVISSEKVRVLRDRISKLNTLMEETLEYAEKIRNDNNIAYMYYIISIIIALLLFICQSPLQSATDMKQLMIFVTVIHLIISGDVESNPGPEYDARDLYGKEPKLSDFQRIFIQSRAARHWQIFGRALDIDVNDLIYCSQPADNMIGTVFERWSDKHQDFTWGTIIDACEGYAQFGKVRDAIDKFLSSRKAHENYGDKPDFESQRSRRSENDQSNSTVNRPVITINVVHVHVHVPTRH